MNKKILIGVIIGVIIIGVVAWLLVGAKKDTAAPSSTTGNTTHANTNNSPADSTITYSDSGFLPAILSVKSGDTVHVINQSSISLQLSSDPHPVHTDDPELNMSVIDPGKDATLKVTRTGTWGYHNHERESDTGKITVN